MTRRKADLTVFVVLPTNMVKSVLFAVGHLTLALEFGLLFFKKNYTSFGLSIFSQVHGGAALCMELIRCLNACFKLIVFNTLIFYLYSV